MFTGNHKLYGCKTEVSVLPNALTIGLSVHYLGAVLDIDVFHKRRNFHEAQLKKRDTDVLPLAEQYPESWACLLEKGHQGAAETLRALYPVKNRSMAGSLETRWHVTEGVPSIELLWRMFLEDSARYGD